MLLKQRLKKVLIEIKEISRIDSAVYANEGEVLATTFKEADRFCEKVEQFIKVEAEALTMEGFHFFRIYIEAEERSYALLVRATVEEAYVIGKLVACQVRNLIEAETESMSREKFIQQILYGNMKEEEIYSHVKRLKIKDAKRIVYLIKTRGKKDTACMQTLRNLFYDRVKDVLIDADEQTIILIKDVENMEAEEKKDIAKMISDNVQAEAMQQVAIAYGKEAEQIKELAISYEQAKAALEMGEIFYGKSREFSYEELTIGKIIYQMSIEQCKELVEEIFAGKEDKLYEEDLKTVQRFFDNDLNLSETARQMYVHRNTLVYRLERIEKAVGLDVRKFEDAMKFRLALMGKARLEQKNGTTIKY